MKAFASYFFKISHRIDTFGATTAKGQTEVRCLFFMYFVHVLPMGSKSSEEEKKLWKHRNKLVYHFHLIPEKKFDTINSHPVEFQDSFSFLFERFNEISELFPFLLSLAYTCNGNSTTTTTSATISSNHENDLSTDRQTIIIDCNLLSSPKVLKVSKCIYLLEWIAILCFFRSSDWAWAQNVHTHSTSSTTDAGAVTVTITAIAAAIAMLFACE